MEQDKKKWENIVAQGENCEKWIISDHLWKGYSFVFDYHVHQRPGMHCGILNVYCKNQI